MKSKGMKKVENRRAPFVSAEVQGAGRRFQPKTFTKILSIYLLVVSLLLLAITLLQQNGYNLINGAITYYLLTAAVAGVLVWLVYGARKLVKRPALKKTMTVSISVIAVLILVYVFTISSARISYVNVDVGRSTSPDGTNELAILRSYYIDVERMTDELRADHPEYTDQQISDAIVERLQTSSGTDLFSYVYVAYPIRGKIFYYTKVEVGPELLIVAQDSGAELRVKWADEDNAVLYVDNPGEYDRGEFSVKCR